MQNTNKTPAEVKVHKKEVKSLAANIFLASIIICFAFISTFFEFDSLASRVVMASSVIVASIFGFFLLVRWINNLDEYELALSARASMTALYSSLFYLPFQYLSEIGLLPEIHITFLFMFVWFVYLINIILHHFK